MPLNDTQVRNTKPREKPFKLSDEGGLFLLVTPAGGKWWRFKYRFGGKEKLLSLGVYPDITLKDARERRDEARKLVARGVDPSAHRKAKKLASPDTVRPNSLEIIAREWLEKFSINKSETYHKEVLARLRRDLFPWAGLRPINEITAPELLVILRRIENKGAHETARRMRQYCGQIFRYATATGRAERDISADLAGALAPVPTKHLATITDPEKIGRLLRDIDNYKGYLITKCALRLAPLVFCRPGELRNAEWSEIRWDAEEWRIPTEKMKMKRPHIIPLSRQSLDVLREIKPFTGSARYIFHAPRSTQRPMSNNAILSALRNMGYAKDEMTGHGFRSMASTLLNENGWNRDAIERQLAHVEGSAARAAYNYAEYLPERRKMMQWWADYLDKLKAIT